MIIKSRVVCFSVLLMVFSGCASISGPLQVGQETGTSKRGESCLSQSLFIINGDASIEAAKKNGGITKVATVDTTFKTTLFVYSEYCTVVYGE